jgi:hypothetical protein
METVASRFIQIKKLANVRRWQALMLIPALLFYGWLFWKAYSTWDSQLMASIHLQPGWIVVATLIQAIGYLFAVSLWGRLVTWLAKPISYIDHIKVYAYSGLAAKLPGLFWGFATRILMYDRMGISKSAIGIASSVETICIAFAASTIAIAMQSFAFSPSETISWMLLALIAAILLVLSHPRVLSRLLARLPNQEVLNALSEISWRRILSIIVGQAAILLMGGFCLYSISYAVVGPSQNLLATSIKTWATTTIWSILLIWLPGDFGLRNSPFVLMFENQFPIPIVVILLAVWRIWVSAMELIWGAVGFVVTAWIERTRMRTSPESILNTINVNEKSAH